MVTGCVLFDVWTEFLIIIYISFGFKGLMCSCYGRVRLARFVVYFTTIFQQLRLYSVE
jgi:hypothetical protein